MTDLTARAFQIADESMVSLLECEGIDHGCDHFVPTADDGREVSRIADASAGFREAVDWLTARGYLERTKDDHGEFVILHRDRMTEAA